MRTLVIYDISDDRKRRKVAEACLDYGLERIQWSAFEGELTTGERMELATRCRAILGRGKDRGEVQFIPVCQKDLVQRSAVTIGKGQSETRRGHHDRLHFPGTHVRQRRSVRLWAATNPRPMFPAWPLPHRLAPKGKARKMHSRGHGFRFF